jgi:hypothetical protein
MRALSRNSKWTSKKYSQEAGENNWALATPKIEARHPRITLDSESSATELVSYQNLDVETGDKLLVKLSDGNYHEVVVESVAKNNPAGTFEISREIADNTYWTVTGEQAIGSVYPGQRIFSNDGTKLWSHKFTTEGLLQYNLSTPYDVTTMSPSGVSLYAPLQSSNSHGWFFADNGRYIFMGAPSYVMHRYTLSTPYDISTAYNLITRTWNTGFGWTEWSTGAISEDGLKMVLFEPALGFAVYTLQTPFDITSLSSTDYGTTTAASSQSLSTNAFMTPNGRDMITYFDDATASPLIKKISFAEPFNLNTISEVILVSDTFGGISGSTGNNAYSRFIGSADLRHITIIGGASSSYNKVVDVSTKLNIPTRIDISTAGLTEVPSEVILVNDLKANISFGNIDSRTSCIPEQLWLENTTATVTSAVVGHPESGKLEVGDTVILNGSDEVVLTAVTETLNGLPYINLDETDGNKLLNIATVNAGPALSLDVYSGPSPKMTFSPDGKKLFVAFNGVSAGEWAKHGISCYNLPTPWDTTTLIPDARGVISPVNFGYSNIFPDLSNFTNDRFLGIQFSEDGTRMFTFMSDNYSFLATQSELSVPWDPYTITSSWKSPVIYNTSSGSTSQKPIDMYIDSGGTSVVVIVHGTSTASANNGYKYNIGISQWDVTSLTTASLVITAATMNFTRNETPDLSTNTYRGVYERFNSDKSVVIFCGSGGTSDGFGTGSMKSIKDNPSILDSSGGPFPAGITLDGDPDEVITDAYVSEDGTKFYVLCVNGNLYEYQIRAETLNKYEIAFASQATVPTTVHIGKRSSPLSLTPTVSTLNSGTAEVTWDSTDVTVDARRVQIQVEGASTGTEVSTIRIDLETL